MATGSSRRRGEAGHRTQVNDDLRPVGVNVNEPGPLGIVRHAAHGVLHLGPIDGTGVVVLPTVTVMVRMVCGAAVPVVPSKNLDDRSAVDNRPAYASFERALRRAGSPQSLYHAVGHDLGIPELTTRPRTNSAPVAERAG